MIPSKYLAFLLFAGFLTSLSFAQTQPEKPADSKFDGPAELPRVHVKSALADTPAPGRSWKVKQGGDVQEAVNKASCGDTVELQAGASFGGPLLLPAKKCDDGHWIILRSGASDNELPPEGTRITPCYAGVASLPGRPAYNCRTPRNVMAKIDLDSKGQYTVIFENGANHYRLIGLEITRELPGRDLRNLVFLEKADAADHIVVDRCWFHGTAQDETAKGFQLGGSTYVAVVDSYFTDFHCIAVTGSCTDAQAIAGGNGDLPMGPYKIENNFLEGSGEPILFGGAKATATAADIEIRRNHIFKPLTWKPDSPDFVGAANGRPFIVKGLFELKNAQRVLFEDNIMENTWGGFTQKGFGILLTPRNQGGKSGNLCPACRVTDVTIRYSIMSHVASCFQIANGLSDSGGVATAGERYSIHDFVCDDVDGQKYKGFGNFVLIAHREPPLHDVKLDHITAFVPNAMLNVGVKGTDVRIANLTFTNNLVSVGEREITSTGGGKQNCAFGAGRGPAGVFEACFSKLEFSNNVIISGGGFPKGNFTPKDANAVKFVNFNNGNGGDYRLRPDSPFKNAGSDHKDPGADINELERRTAGIR
jgi:hypothetical protein